MGKEKSLNWLVMRGYNRSGLVCLNDEQFERVLKEEFIQSLKDKNLAFGWYKGEFVKSGLA